MEYITRDFSFLLWKKQEQREKIKAVLYLKNGTR